jgi:predicted DNA-binding protein
MVELSQGEPIPLDAEQYARVQQIAQSQGKPVATVVQEVLCLGLEMLQQRRLKRLDVLAQLNDLRLAIYQEHGMYTGDLISEMQVVEALQVQEGLRESL